MVAPMAEKTTPYKTKTGKVLTDVDVEAMARHQWKWSPSGSIPI